MDSMKLYEVEVIYRAIVTAESATDAQKVVRRLRSEITDDVETVVLAAPVRGMPAAWVGCPPYTTLPHGDPRREWTVDQWIADAATRAVL